MFFIVLGISSLPSAPLFTIDYIFKESNAIYRYNLDCTRLRFYQQAKYIDHYVKLIDLSLILSEFVVYLKLKSILHIANSWDNAIREISGHVTIRVKASSADGENLINGFRILTPLATFGQDRFH